MRTFLDSPAGWWTVLGGLVVLLLIPLAVTDFPPVLDYPNHLARLFVLARAGSDPVLDRMYQPHWAIIPDLAIDVIGPPLINLFGVFPAGKIILALALLAPLAGALSYSRLVFRTRLYWPMSASLISYNLFFVLGFMNYLLAIGIALAAAGLWIRLAGHRFAVRALTGAACACLLFFVHAFGVAFFGLLVGAAELQWYYLKFLNGNKSLKSLLRPAALLFTSFTGPAVLWLSTSGSSHDVTWGWSFFNKIFFLISPFSSYDNLSGFFATIIVITFFSFILSLKSTKIAPGVQVSCLVIFIFYLLTHFAQAGGDFVDSRMPLMVVAILCAAIAPGPIPKRASNTALICAMLAFLLTWLPPARIWVGPNREAEQIQKSISQVSPGSRVLVVMPKVSLNLPYWKLAPPSILAVGGIRIDYQLPALLVIERQAFWPLLFSDPSQHPIVVNKTYRDLAISQGFPPYIPSLIARKSLIPHWPAPYLKHWPKNFDYLLVIDAGAIPNLAHFMPGRLKLLNISHFVALFRIRHHPALASGAGS